MAPTQNFEETYRLSSESPDGSLRRAVILTCGPGAFDLSWPILLICAIFAGFMIALTFGSAVAKVRSVDPIHRLFAASDRVVEPTAQEALVITANQSHQLAVVATLSPRGFHPLVASSGREVLAQIRAHAGTLRVAVVDAALPDYASIADALRDAIPAGGIILLKYSYESQEIGPMLLNRL